ncbi:MAG: DUF6166 domain-containing protein [Candidatus Methylomirabilales bacterium]
MARTYRGTPQRTKRGGYVVEVVEEDGRRRPLPPRTDLWNHSPDGFAWGYGGSGPAQLALALAADLLGDDERAVRLHQAFKWEVVAKWPSDLEWEVAEDRLREWLLEAEQVSETDRPPRSTL